MGAKRATRPSKTKPSSKPPGQPSRLQNLAARPPQFGDEAEDEGMIADNSGVFRVTSAIKQAQTGHDEDDATMFPNNSLVMQAQRDSFREDGTPMTDVVEENAVLDAASQAEKKQRLATLVARSRMHKRR
jgi:hypothetical protein